MQSSVSATGRKDRLVVRTPLNLNSNNYTIHYLRRVKTTEPGAKFTKHLRTILRHFVHVHGLTTMC